MNGSPSMRSAELAELAGVTVRTLRHYHALGVLPEPERSYNGYRNYTVKHLAMVLRIQSFTRLGVPLEEVRRVIDDPVATGALLDRIDAAAAADIERLTDRRIAIAELRDVGGSPDLPAALVPYLALLTAARTDRSSDEDRFDREQLAMIRHFTGDTRLAWLAAALEQLSASATDYVTLIDAFTDLTDDADPAEIEDLATRIAELLGPAVPVEAVPALDARAAELMLAHQDDFYSSDAQRQVMLQVTELLNARATAADPGTGQASS